MPCFHIETYQASDINPYGMFFIIYVSLNKFLYINLNVHLIHPQFQVVQNTLDIDTMYNLTIFFTRMSYLNIGNNDHPSIIYYIP